MKASLRSLALAAVLGLAVIPQAQAQLLDEIELSQDGMEARIQLNAPVHYLRHFPTGNAQTFEIFFQIISKESADHMTTDEYKIAPPSDKLPRFTVTYPKQGASRLVLQFCRTVDLKVRLGEDNRSFVLSIKPVNLLGQSGGEPGKVVNEKNQPAANDSQPATDNTALASDTHTTPSVEIKTPAAEPQQPVTGNSKPTSEGSK